MFTKNKHPIPQTALTELVPQINACRRRIFPSN